MSHSQKTANYSLPIFVDNDQPTWLGDVNSAMKAIDTGIYNVKAAGDTTTAALLTVQNTVSDHTASIAELHEGVDTLEKEFASITTATDTKEGLVKIAAVPGESGITAFSQVGAQSLLNGGLSSPTVLASEVVSLVKGNVTSGAVGVTIAYLPVSHLISISAYADSDSKGTPITATGAASIRENYMKYTLPTGMRPNRDVNIVLDCAPLASVTLSLNAHISTSGQVDIRFSSNGACTNIDIGGSNNLMMGGTTNA